MDPDKRDPAEVADEKMKPCPFCGTTPKLRFRAGRLDAYRRLSVLGWLECPTCEVGFSLAWQDDKTIAGKIPYVNCSLWGDWGMDPTAKRAATAQLRLELLGLWNTRTAYAEQTTELERLRLVVDKLPKTADGVPVVPGTDRVWIDTGVIGIKGSGGIDCNGWASFGDKYGCCRSRRTSDGCYSTPEATKAAEERTE